MNTLTAEMDSRSQGDQHVHDDDRGMCTEQRRMKRANERMDERPDPHSERAGMADPLSEYCKYRDVLEDMLW